MNTVQAIAIALLQGATELFPVSSLGHAVILPALLHWKLDEHAASFLPFLVMLHVGTALALLGYFWRDWWALGTGVLGFGTPHRVDESRRVLLLIIIATIPGVIIGFLLEHFFETLFGTPLVAAAFLMVNGGVLLVGEQVRGQGSRPLSTLTTLDAVIIGCCQCGALIPGISRSGITIVGGLLRGIDHEGSAHFSFLIATPIIVGATVLEVPKLLHGGMTHGVLNTAVLAAFVAGVTALASTAFLMKYFRENDRWALNPFAYYCIAAGLVSAALLLAR